MTLEQLRESLRAVMADAIAAHSEFKVAIYKDALIIVHPDHEPQMVRIERIGYNSPEVEPVAAQVFLNPTIGDQLTYNGRRWAASNVKGVLFHVGAE